MFMKNKSLSTDLSTSIPQTRSVFVIFVHFGKSETTHAAIQALLKGSVLPTSIVVVDHAEIALRPISSVTIIRPNQNTGYMGGLEVGIATLKKLGATNNDVCILLNNDAFLSVGSLRAVISWWELHGGPLVLAGATAGYVSLFSGRAIIASGTKRRAKWMVPYIHGSSIVAEFGLFSSLRLPTELFLYWEDVALSMEVQGRGGRLAVIRNFHVIHNDAEGSISLSKLFYLVRNGAYVLERYTSLPWRVYWYGMNTFRMGYHFQRRGIRHATIVRALRNARASRLGKAEL